MKSIQVNPFIIGAYAGSHYFCDCERETDEKVAVNVTSGELRRYHLKSPSSVQSALKGLSGKGMVGKTLDRYVINDRLFRFWIKRNPIW